MEEPFKPLSLSIKELFGNTDSLYKIPRYQRPYKWEDEHVMKLWDDLFDSYDDNERNYFLGSVITVKARDSEAYVDVVDGQQRLTTLMILFCVIRDLFPQLNEAAAAANPLVVGLDTIKDSIFLRGKTGRLKFFTDSQYQSEFDSLVVNGDTKKLKKPYQSQIRLDEEPKYKFINTACIFKERLLTMDSTKAEKFVDYIFNRVNVIRIDCTDQDFAIKLFQVLNNRGVDLSPADLIKSYLLGNLYAKYKEDSDMTKLKEDQFISNWREMESSLKTCDIGLNELFILYQYYNSGLNPRKSLYEELQDEFKEKDPNTIISDVKSFAGSYFEGVFEAEDPMTYALWYLRWNMQWKSILVTAIHTSYPQLEALKKVMRRFFYLHWIAGKTLSDVKHPSFSVIRAIKEKKSVGDIKAELDEILSKGSIIGLAVAALSSKDIASSPWCKPLLLMFEYNSADESKSSFIDLAKDLHLEHILPTKYSEFSEWGHITKETADTWLNSAGNLTLLSGSKNIEASNNPFYIKMKVYDGKGKYEQKDTKITAFKITQAILQDYNTNKYQASWNIDSMRARWKWFFAQAEQLLEIDVSEALKKHDPIEN